MKSLFALATLVFSLNSSAGWVETIECQLSRGSVDTGTTATSVLTGVLKMTGPNNAETGRLVLKSPMLPAYSVILEKASSGRTDVSTLTTALGTRIMAKSSVDDQQSEPLDNRFVTAKGDFQVSLSCRQK